MEGRADMADLATAGRGSPCLIELLSLTEYLANLLPAIIWKANKYLMNLDFQERRLGNKTLVCVRVNLGCI